MTGQELKKWRSENHISRADFAIKANYSYDRISKIESKNLPLSKRLKNSVETLDAELNPETDQVIKKWNKIKEFYTFFDKEIDYLEANLLQILDIDINKNGISHTTEHLKYIGITLGILNSIIKSNYENEDQYKTDVIPLIRNISSESRVYLKHKSQK